jgi:Thiamine monophosphate kinase
MNINGHNKIISHVGEFSLISKIDALLKNNGTTAPENMRLGIGDDCAVISIANGCDIVVTCDSMVENEHYLPFNIICHFV